jgi:hypothetical protein
MAGMSRDNSAKRLSLAAAHGAPAKEGRNFMAVAADCHGTPAAAVRAGIVIKEQPAGGIGAAADGRARSLDEEFRGGAGESGEEPVEAAFARDKLERPGTLVRDELVVAFRDAQNSVDGFDPGCGERFVVGNGGEDRAERFAEAKNAQQHRVDGLRFPSEQRPEARGAIHCDLAGINKEGHEFIPGEIASRGRQVGEIERKAACDKIW